MSVLYIAHVTTIKVLGVALYGLKPLGYWCVVIMNMCVKVLILAKVTCQYASKSHGIYTGHDC